MSSELLTDRRLYERAAAAWQAAADVRAHMERTEIRLAVNEQREDSIRLRAAAQEIRAERVRYRNVLEELRQTIAGLEAAMQTRAVIEQAKGIIMARERCAPDQAFDVLRRAVQRTNRKVTAIAGEIVERAQQPVPRGNGHG